MKKKYVLINLAFLTGCFNNNNSSIKSKKLEYSQKLGDITLKIEKSDKTQFDVGKLISAIDSCDLEKVKGIIDERPELSELKADLELSLMVACTCEWRESTLIQSYIEEPKSSDVYDSSFKERRIKIIELLLKDMKKFDITILNACLIEAASTGFIEAVELLLNAGADVNAVDKNGNTAFIVGAIYQNLIKFLMDAGADVNALNNNGENALSFAVKFNKAESVGQLLGYGINKNIINTKGENLLYIASKVNADERLIILLLNNIIDPNAKAEDGLSAISLATKNLNVLLKDFIFAKKALSLTKTNELKRVNNTIEIIRNIYLFCEKNELNIMDETYRDLKKEKTLISTLFNIYLYCSLETSQKALQEAGLGFINSNINELLLKIFNNRLKRLDCPLFSLKFVFEPKDMDKMNKILIKMYLKSAPVHVIQQYSEIDLIKKISISPNQTTDTILVRLLSFVGII